MTETTIPFLGYKDDLEKIQWGLEHPHSCLGWFKPAVMVQNGAGVCSSCFSSVRVDVNGEPLRHDRKPYRTSAQRGGARERVPL